VGPEIVQALVRSPPEGVRLLLVGDPEVLADCGGPAVPAVASPRDAAAASLPVAFLPAAPVGEPVRAGRVSPAAGRASFAWVEAAARLALAREVDGIVTAPVHKEAWHAAGVSFPGHTEALRDLAGVERVLMLLVGGRLRTALATIHVPLRAVPGLLATDALTADLVLLDREIAACFGPARPRIAVCGLNPHAGEGGLFGTEDAEVIRPAVEAARAAGVDAVGPLPADACIPAAVHGAYDAVFAMYHDQALPAVKAVARRRGVNVTLGLPFVRTSVDHGTAFDIAGRGVADPGSLAAAIATAAAIARRAATRPSAPCRSAGARRGTGRRR